MERALDPVYEAARSRLEALLDAFGFELASECHHPDAFGSATAQYRRPGMRLEIEWDGKDRWLWIKVAPTRGASFPPAEAWRDLERELGEQPASLVLRPGPTANGRIAALEGALRRYLDGR